MSKQSCVLGIKSCTFLKKHLQILPLCRSVWNSWCWCNTGQAGMELKCFLSAVCSRLISCWCHRETWSVYGAPIQTENIFLHKHFLKKSFSNLGFHSDALIAVSLSPHKTQHKWRLISVFLWFRKCNFKFLILFFLFNSFCQRQPVSVLDLPLCAMWMYVTCVGRCAPCFWLPFYPVKAVMLHWHQGLGMWALEPADL